MKKAIFIIVILMFSCFAYTSVSYNIEGVTVVKELEVIEETRIDPIGGMKKTVYTSTVSYYVENNGIPKREIKLIEDEGIIWSMENVDALEKNEYSYSVDEEMNSDDFRSQELGLEVDNKDAIITVQEEGKVGEELTLLVVSEDFEPFRNVEVILETPEGEERVVTDNSGKAEFIPSSSGVYRYKIEGVIIQNYLETEIAPLIEQGTTTALIEDVDDLGISGFIPIIIGLIILSVILFGLIIHYSGKNEESFKMEFPDVEERAKIKEEKKTTTEYKTDVVEATPAAEVYNKIEEIKRKKKKIAENNKKIREKILKQMKPISKGKKRKR